MLGWLRDYHVDGLRLDAVHALVDHNAVHLLEQMAAEVESLSTHLGRPLSLIAESDLNDPRLITPREAGGYGLQAQWDDDVHHALHALLTGERQGYYGDFGSLDGLETVLTGAFFHAGTWSSFRRRRHGRPVDRHTDARATGSSRTCRTTTRSATARSATGCPRRCRPACSGSAPRCCSPRRSRRCCSWARSGRPATRGSSSPATPSRSWPRRCSNGRRREFASHGWAEADVPDPQDPATFERSKLDWSERGKPGHAEILDLLQAADRAAPQPAPTCPTRGWTGSRSGTATSTW